MKHADFLDLCQREWDRDTGWPFRGDVVALTLTGPSLAELTEDVLASGNGNRLCRLPRATSGSPDAAGASVSILSNPVTRSQVPLTVVAQGPEMAVVSYGPGQPQRVVPVREGA